MRRAFVGRGSWMTSMMAATWAWLPQPARGQVGDTTKVDSLRRYALAPVTVSVARAERPLSKIPLAVQSVGKAEISRARPTWGLDEALFSVPGVYVANRYNFSVDQRVSIRGFGARSAFAVRGVKILLDGIPQTLPDGQGQLTNVELGEADRIEVLRGSSSALYGNASGGVISIWTHPAAPRSVSQELRVVAGAFDRHNRRNWSKWQSSTNFAVGRGGALVTVSRLNYEGERDHTEADFRNFNARVRLPISPAWSLSAMADVGDQPVANNPGSLTLNELRANRDSAASQNLLRDAGKDVLQAQGGVTLTGRLGGGEAVLTVFGLTRDLTNPLPQGYITFDRRAYGARAAATSPTQLGSLPLRVTAGVDLQWQRDDRQEYSYKVGITPSMTTPNNEPDTLTRNQLERVNEFGPFVQGVLELTPTVSVTGGLRYDRVSFKVTDRHLTDGANDSGERLMDAVSWTGGVAVNPAPSITIYGNVGTSFETPTTTELNNQPTGAGGFNTDLEPQQATNYEIGARGVVAGRASWSLALFQADVRDELISYEVPAFPTRRFFRNAGSARHRGVELGAEVDLVPGLNLLVNWTYSDFRYVDYQVESFDLRARAIPGIPQHVLHLGLRARPGFAGGAWVDVETAHSSGVLVNDTLGTKTSLWWVTNVRVGWEGTAGGFRLSPFVGFNNVFNRKYIGSVTINARFGRYYEPAPGRNLYLGFTLGAGR